MKGYPPLHASPTKKLGFSGRLKHGQDARVFYMLAVAMELSYMCSSIPILFYAVYSFFAGETLILQLID